MGALLRDIRERLASSHGMERVSLALVRAELSGIVDELEGAMNAVDKDARNLMQLRAKLNYERTMRAEAEAEAWEAMNPVADRR
jgi:hypothetical protein